MLGDLSSELLAALIMFIVVKVWRDTSRWRDKAVRRRFWILKHGRVVIVMPSHPMPLLASRSERGVKREDAFAANRLVAVLRDLGIPVEVIEDHQPIPGNADLVLVGSPRGNLHSMEYNRRVELPFELRDPSPGSASPTFVSLDGVPFESPMDHSSDSVDRAMVARFYDDRVPRMVFLMWGLHGIGTLGAVRALQDKATVRELNRGTGDSDFAAILHVPFDAARDPREVKILARERFGSRLRRRLQAPLQAVKGDGAPLAVGLTPEASATTEGLSPPPTDDPER